MRLDFAGGRLGDAGLFAITGKTGAGKSVLLGCHLLWRYTIVDSLARNLTKRTMLKSVVMMKINASKPMMFVVSLSRGKGEGFVSCILLLTMAHIGVLTWHVRRARARAEGKIQAAEQWLENIETGQRFAGKKQELQAEIEKATSFEFRSVPSCCDVATRRVCSISKSGCR